LIEIKVSLPDYAVHWVPAAVAFCRRVCRASLCWIKPSGDQLPCETVCRHDGCSMQVDGGGTQPIDGERQKLKPVG
jgi:hypothetical protein